MKASRELDALVAEKVMGCKTRQHPTWAMPWPICDCKDERHRMETRDPGLIELKRYSTDIAAAWELVLKIPMTVYAPGASFAHGEYGNGKEWCAEACPEDKEYYESVYAYADTAPLAICLTALKAVGVEL